MRLAVAPQQEVDSQWQPPAFLVSTAQTESFPDQVHFRTKELGQSRLAEPGLEVAPPGFIICRKTQVEQINSESQCLQVETLTKRMNEAALWAGGLDLDGESRVYAKAGIH